MRIPIDPFPPRDDEKVAVVHVARPALPWRPSKLTECGLPLADHPVIDREEFVAKVKAQGQRRAAMSTCMTCFDTAARWPSWDEDPVQCLNREVQRCGFGTGRWPRNDANSARSVFGQELVAIAVLIKRHREEFDELLEDQAATVDINKGRA